MADILPPDLAALEASDKVVATIALDRSSAESTLAVCDPFDGSVISHVPDLGAEAAVEAVARADTAGRAWEKTTPRRRADLLRAWYDRIVARSEDITLLISRETGKPLSEARAEVGYGGDFVRWYAEQALRPGGNTRDIPAGGGLLLTRRAPVGLSVLITPWNFPLAMATRKIAPALAAGCATVIKPSPLTPLTTVFVVRLAVEAGLPEDLIQVVTTSQTAGFSERVLRDRRVRKVSFTGSTSVGNALLRLAADNVLRSSMELGGNAPVLVFDDADLERAVEGALAAKLRNGGQSCIAANRFFVQEGIADAFIEAMTERMRTVPMGSGLAPGVGLGPMIDDKAVASLGALVEDAARRGARVRTGGAAADHPGSFFEATLLDEVPSDAVVATMEIFGPIAAVQRFATQEEAVARANDTAMGLAGYVFTENLDRAFNVADQLQTGLVGINQGVPSNAAAPFGGMKQSGLGREGGAEGLEEYQEVRFYNLALRPTG